LVLTTPLTPFRLKDALDGLITMKVIQDFRVRCVVLMDKKTFLPITCHRFPIQRGLCYVSLKQRRRACGDDMHDTYYVFTLTAYQIICTEWHCWQCAPPILISTFPSQPIELSTCNINFGNFLLDV